MGTIITLFFSYMFLLEYSCFLGGFPNGSVGKESACKAGDIRDVGSIPGSGRRPWMRKWQPTSVFLPGESRGQRSLGTTVHGVIELDRTERLSAHT